MQRIESKWISVNERMPEKNGEYLVTCKFLDYNHVYIKSYAHNLHKIDEFDFCDKFRSGWYDYDSEYGFYECSNVIAWMSLPEPYQEGDKE